MSNSIHYALWEVTQKCNLNCIHCRADASPLKIEGKLIDGDNVLRLIDELKELNCPILSLTGGEPLLRHDIVGIVKYATSRGIKTRIQSNGLLLTEPLASQLKEAGLFSYGIGLDGSNPKINDKIRNYPGALKGAIKSIKILKKIGVKIHVEFTVTRINIDDVNNTLNMLEKLGVDTFLARATLFSGRARQDNNEFLLSSIDYKKFMMNLAKEKERRKMKIILNCQDPLYHLADNTIVEKLKTFGDIYDGKIISGCTAGLNMIHIRSNGEIGVCTFLSDITLGNFYEKKLTEIWKNRFNNPQIKRLASRNYEGTCKNCRDRFICGGCRARALSIKGDLFAQDPYCWKYKSLSI